MTATHPFDDALVLDMSENGSARGRTSAAYNNMVGPFGGITAATLVRAVQLQPDCHGEPVSITVNFAGPIKEGDFEITARVVRTNRSNQHWYLELTQDAAVATSATAVFGTRRDTWDDLETAPPRVPAPAEVERTGLPDMIAWAQNYEMRFASGGLAEVERPESESALWVRDAVPRPLDHLSLTSMSDVFYPRVFQRLGRFVPAGTISLTVHYFATADELAAHGEDHVLATARARRFHRGYFDQSVELWGRSGSLLATSHQIVYYKA